MKRPAVAPGALRCGRPVTDRCDGSTTRPNPPRTTSFSPETFERITAFDSEREICDIVWLVAREHLDRVSNIGLNIGSDGLCDLRGHQTGVAPDA